MFSSSDYETTMRVLKAHSCEELAEGFVEFAKQAKAKERAMIRQVEKITEVLESNYQEGYYTQALRVYTLLLDLGWTPPKEAA